MAHPVPAYMVVTPPPGGDNDIIKAKNLCFSDLKLNQIEAAKLFSCLIIAASLDCVFMKKWRQYLTKIRRMFNRCRAVTNVNMRKVVHNLWQQLVSVFSSINHTNPGLVL